MGLGASIGGVAYAANNLAKHLNVPATAKAGILVGGAITGGLVHTATSNLNRQIAERLNKKISKNNDLNNNVESSTSTSNIESVVDINNGPSCPYEADWIYHLFVDNPIEVALYSLYGLNIISIFFVWFIFINLFSKYFINKELELNFLDKIIPQPYNITIKNIIRKILNLYSKSSNINIFLALFFFIF
jgi:hypothetical protein